VVSAPDGFDLAAAEIRESASVLRVGGLDLSLTSTGLARIDGERLTTWVHKPSTLRGFERLESIIETTLSYLADRDVIAVEGLSFGAKGSAMLDLAGLRAVVTLELHRAGLTVADVPPAVVKKYATGVGGADKFAVYAQAVKRLGGEFVGDDAADAAWLAHMAADYYGCPLVTMPAVSRAVLCSLTIRGRRKGLPVVEWPDLATVAGPPAAAGQERMP